MCFGAPASLLYFVSWQNEFNFGSECILFLQDGTAKIFVIENRWDIDVIFFAYLARLGGELHLKVYLILEVIFRLTCWKQSNIGSTFHTQSVRLKCHSSHVFKRVVGVIQEESHRQDFLLSSLTIYRKKEILAVSAVTCLCNVLV